MVRFYEFVESQYYFALITIFIDRIILLFVYFALVLVFYAVILVINVLGYRA